MSPVESDEQDLTRKQRREQARSERKAMEEAAAASAMRRTRLTQLGGVVGVVVIAIIVILLATGGGGKKGIPASKHEQTSVTNQVSALLGGIHQSGDVLGSATAPVSLQYFGDLECPICQKFTLGALPSVIQTWVRTGKLRIEYRALMTATREKETFNLQQVAALAAGKQGKMWNFIETFYHEQGEEGSGYVTEKYIQGIASQVPSLELAKWSSDRGNPEFAKQIETDAQAANGAGFNGTPSFLIGRSGGAMSKLEYTNPESPSFIDEAVEKLVKA